MAEINELLNDEQKLVFIQALAYTLSLGENCGTAVKNDYLKNQAQEAGICATAFKKIKKDYKDADLIKDINTIQEIRVKRYILREMILLALADHEMTDTEIETIYKIGAKIGIKNEKVSDFFMWAAKGLEWQIEGTKLVEEDL